MVFILTSAEGPLAESTSQGERVRPSRARVRPSRAPSPGRTSDREHVAPWHSAESFPLRTWLSSEKHGRIILNVNSDECDCIDQITGRKRSSCTQWKPVT